MINTEYVSTKLKKNNAVAQSTTTNYGLKESDGNTCLSTLHTSHFNVYFIVRCRCITFLLFFHLFLFFSFITITYFINMFSVHYLVKHRKCAYFLLLFCFFRLFFLFHFHVAFAFVFMW